MNQAMDKKAVKITLVLGLTKNRLSRPGILVSLVHGNSANKKAMIKLFKVMTRT